MSPRHALDSAKRAATGWVDDRAASMGAALSYYTVFSISPLLVIAIAVAGLVFGEDAARGAIVGQLQGLLGDDAAKTIQQLLASTSEPKKSVIATIVGFLLLLLGATTVFAELQDDLNRIWKVPQKATPTGLWGWIRARILSFGMVLAIGFLLLVSLVASAAISAVGEWGGGVFGAWEALAHVIEIVISFGLLSAMFAVMYRFLPDLHIAWRDVWVGALVTALLFTIGKFAIGLYIGKSGTASTYGAAGSLVVLLLWVYYSAQIFLYGAEFTAAYSHAYGSRRENSGEKAGAAPGVQPSKPALPDETPAPAPAGRPATALAVAREATPPTRPAMAEPEPRGVTAPIARHPVSAIGVAAGLGAAVALAIRQWERTHPSKKHARRKHATARHKTVAVRRAAATPQRPVQRPPKVKPPSAAASIAKALASAVAGMATRALTERLKRGAKRGVKRGWREGSAGTA